MAITITQNPDVSAFNDQRLIYMASSTNIAQPKFKYVVEIYRGGSLVDKYYIAKNPSDYLIFDLQKTGQHYNDIDTTEYGTTNQSLITLGDTAGQTFSRNTHSCKLFEVRIGEVYEVAGVLIEYLNLANHSTYLFTGKRTFLCGQAYDIDQYYPQNTKVGWMLPAQSKPVIKWRDLEARNLIPINQDFVFYADDDDYGTLSFIHDDGAIFSGADSYAVRYIAYDTSGTQIGAIQDIIINAANGAASPTSTNEANKLIYFGAYPANLSETNHASVVKPDAVTWGYYSLQLRTSLGGSAGKVVYIVNRDICYKSKIRVHWFTNVTGWQSFNFYTYTTKKKNVKSKNYKSILGDYASTSHIINPSERTTTAFHVDTDVVYEIESDWLSTYDYITLETLIESKEIRISVPQIPDIPVVLKTTNYTNPDTNSVELKKVKFKLEAAIPC